MKKIFLFLFLCSFSFALPFSVAAGLELNEPASDEIETNQRLELSVSFSRENYDNPLVQIDTSMGAIILELFPREAPVAVANFLALAEGSKEFLDPDSGEWVQRPFYDGLIFHRVVNNFMVQGGSPNGLGTGVPGYNFNDEINARSLGLDKMMVLDDEGTPHPFLGIKSQMDFQQKVLGPLYQKMGITNQAELDESVDAISNNINKMTVKESYENLGYQYTERVISRNLLRGVIAMANSGPNSNGSQFFISLIDTPWLTGKHTVFGKVWEGMDVLDGMSTVRVDARSRPFNDIVILSIRQLQN